MAITENKNKTTKTEIELYVINKVRELRIAHELSQEQLAIELKFDISFVGQAERLSRTEKYNLNHLNEIAKFFNVPFSSLFPPMFLQTDCVEEYMELHPRMREKYEKMQRERGEKSRKKLAEEKKTKPRQTGKKS